MGGTLLPLMFRLIIQHFKFKTHPLPLGIEQATSSSSLRKGEGLYKCGGRDLLATVILTTFPHNDIFITPVDTKFCSEWLTKLKEIYLTGFF